MALLTGHILNGKVIGVEQPLNSAVLEPFKIEDTVSAGYADISTVENWWKYGRDLGKDYLFIRKEIKKLIDQKALEQCGSDLADPPLSPTDGEQHCIIAPATGDWVGYEGYIGKWDEANTQWVKEPPDHVGYRLLNDAERDIAAHYKIGSQLDHFTDYGIPSIVDYGLDYHRNSIDARRERMLRAAVEVYNRLPLNSPAVLQAMISNPISDLTELFIRWGRKGSLEDFNVDFNPNPTPAIMDYIMARAPFNGQEPYLSAGYPAGMKISGWTPIDGVTLAEFCDEIENILVRGIW